MKVLITGANGRIGRVTAGKLAGTAELILVDHQAKNADLAEFGKQVNLDLLDKAAVSDLLASEKPAVIIHLAGIVGKTVGGDTAGLAYQVNVEATLALAREAAKAGVQKFIFASSSAVYPTRTLEPLSENAENLQPESEYGKQKYLAEQELEKIARETGMQVICLRIFNVYGPGFTDSLLNKLVGSAKAGAAAVNIVDPDNFVRDYINVNDVAEAFTAVISNLKSAEKFMVINIGSGIARSTSALIKELESKGIKPRINLEAGKLSTSVVADTNKAGELLGFKAHQSVLVNQL